LYRISTELHNCFDVGLFNFDFGESMERHFLSRSGLTNLMIIAVRNDPIKRRTWEDVFSEELAEHGVKSTQSYRLFPNGVPDSDQIAEAVAKNGFEGIVINRSLPKRSPPPM